MMTFDPFQSAASSIIAPASTAFQIIPDDILELPSATRAIYVGMSGDVAARLIGNSAPVVFRNLVAGTLLPLRIEAVLATGTTADNLVGLA